MERIVNVLLQAFVLCTVLRLKVAKGKGALSRELGTD